MSNSETDIFFNYYNPVNINFGFNKYHLFIKKIVNGNFKRAALFYGRESMKKAGVIDKIKESLDNCLINEYGGVLPNPKVSDIEKFVTTCKESYDVIIAVGGGSVIDFAKSAAFLLPQNQSIRAILKDRPENLKNSIPFIAVPTTAGTGSEVTPWASLWDGTKKKYSLSHKKMFPSYAVLDPALTIFLPAKVTAYTAFDALSHALEALWSKNSNPVSDVFAFESVSMFVNTYDRLMDNLSDPELRSGMLKTSLYAGMAFSNTKTAAVHSVSYPVTMHFNVPHGEACALLLGEFLLFNKDYIEKSKVDTLCNIFRVKNFSELKEKLANMAQNGGLAVRLSQAGIDADGIDIIVREGFSPDRILNNPRDVTKQDLYLILNNIF